jgi:hypothetical protein
MRGETKTKKNNIIYKALHRKLNIEQYEPTKTEGKHWSFGSGLNAPLPFFEIYKSRTLTSLRKMGGSMKRTLNNRKG